MAENGKILLINACNSADIISKICRWREEKYSDCRLHVFIQASYLEKIEVEITDRVKKFSFVKLEEFSNQGKKINLENLRQKVREKNFRKVILFTEEKILGKHYLTNYYWLWWYLEAPVEVYYRDSGFSDLRGREFIAGLLLDFKDNYLWPLVDTLITLLFLPVNIIFYILYSLFDRLSIDEFGSNLSMPLLVFLGFVRENLWTREGDLQPEDSVLAYRRYPTALLRKLPDFLFLGVEKCGTTSLNKFLRGHPQIELPLERRSCYFRNQEFNLHGDAWYRCFFPLELSTSRADKLQYERAISYFQKPDPPKNISLSLPDARFILILRNPVDRAYSHYHAMEKRSMLESFEAGDDDGDKVNFKETIDRELSFLPPLEEVKEPEDLLGRGPRTVRVGLYHIYFERWLEYFARDQFLVVKSENLFEHPSQPLARVSEFLGVQEFENKGDVHVNRGDYPPMQEETREYLQNLYRPFNQEFYDLVGRDLGW